MVIIMMNKCVKKVEIDWNVLDEHWATQYEADYSHFFTGSSSERKNILIPTPLEVKIPLEIS